MLLRVVYSIALLALMAPAVAASEMVAVAPQELDEQVMTQVELDSGGQPMVTFSNPATGSLTTHSLPSQAGSTLDASNMDHRELANDPMGLCPDANGYNTNAYPGASGYWFTSPIDMYIVGLSCLAYLSPPTSQNVQVIFSDSTSFADADITTVYYNNSLPYGSPIAMNIFVPAGQYVGILGSTVGGSFPVAYWTCSFNTFPTTIDSIPVTLTGILAGSVIGSQAATQFSVSNRLVGRIQMYYSTVTESPSNFPSHIPSRSPSTLPSHEPSRGPSAFPSLQPSASPTQLPSHKPSRRPSSSPSTRPSKRPSHTPSKAPSSAPTALPSEHPSASVEPSTAPTTLPSALPSVYDPVYTANIKKCLRRVFRKAKCTCTTTKKGLRCLQRATTTLCVRRYRKKNLLNTKAEVQTFRTKMEVAYGRECGK